MIFAFFCILAFRVISNDSCFLLRCGVLCAMILVCFRGVTNEAFPGVGLRRKCAKVATDEAETPGRQPSEAEVTANSLAEVAKIWQPSAATSAAPFRAWLLLCALQA